MIRLTDYEAELIKSRRLMAQRPHASSLNRGKWKPKTDSKRRARKRTYSIGDSDRIDFLYSPPRVQWWAPLEKLMEDRREVLERSQKRGRSEVLERWWLKWEWDYLLTFPINTCFQFNNIIIKCSFHFYHFYSDDRFSRLLQSVW